MSNKKGYLLKTVAWNGSIQVQNHYCVILDREVAEEAKIAVDKANDNNNSDFSVSTLIEEIEIYETRDDVPILNKQ